MYYRCYVYKGTADGDDFETNYKSQAVEVDKIIYGSSAIDFLKNQTYTEFKGNIDGEVITWADVKFKEYDNFYELFLEV